MMKSPVETQSVQPLELRLKRLKYRAWHRGFREADLILGPFADAHVEAMTLDQLSDFERLLTAPDQDLYDWILEVKPADPYYDGAALTALVSFVRRMRAP